MSTPLPNGSASAIERVIACPGSLALSTADRSTSYTRSGHDKHAFLERVLNGTPVEDALRLVAKDSLETCRSIRWDRIVGGLQNLRAESAYVVNVRERTARWIGSGVSRHYGELGEWEIPGTMDLEAEKPDDFGGPPLPVVTDYKTGYQVVPVEDNGQGLLLSAAKQLATGAPEVLFRVAKIKPSGAVWLDEVTHSVIDTDTFLDQVEDALAASKAAKLELAKGHLPVLRQGPWCTYCSAAPMCPAKITAARGILGELQKLAANAVELMSPDDAGRAYEMAHEQAQPLIDMIVEPIRERAKLEPLPLSGGRVLRPIIYDREDAHRESLLNLARELGATDEQIAACYRVQEITKVQATKDPRQTKPKKGRAP